METLHTSAASFRKCVLFSIFLLLAGCGDPSEIIIDSRFKGKVVVHTKSGRVLHTFERKQREATRDIQYDELLLSSALSPNQKSLLIVLGYDMPKGSSAERKPERYELVLVNLSDSTRKVLHNSDSELPLISPQWTRDGKRIAVLRGSHVVMLTIEGDELWSAEIPGAAIRHPRERADTWGGYIRFSKDEKRLFIHARQRDIKETNVATMDLETKFVEWSSLGRIYFMYGKCPAALFANIDESQHEMVSALFGSPENPVLCPRMSSDGQYYFYYTRKEGLLASAWVEGYSRATGETFKVITYQRRIYAE